MPPPNLNPYRELLSTEQSVMLKLEKAIDSKIPENLETALGALKKYKLNTQAKFIYHSPKIIKEFCQAQKEILDSISTNLAKHGCPNIDVTSKQSKTRQSIFDHAFSNYLLQIFTKLTRSNSSENARVNILNDACKLGSYYGFVMRAKFNLIALNTLNPDSSTAKNMLTRIHHDADQLIDLYGAIGYARKGFILLRIAQYFHEKGGEAYKETALSNKEQAIKNFLCAAELEKEVYSKALITSITQGRGITDIFTDDNDMQFDSWEKAHPIFIENVGRETYNSLSKQVTATIQPELARRTAIDEDEKTPSPSVK
jgi:hypothetical protein